MQLQQPYLAPAFPQSIIAKGHKLSCGVYNGREIIWGHALFCQVSGEKAMAQAKKTILQEVACIQEIHSCCSLTVLLLLILPSNSSRIHVF